MTISCKRVRRTLGKIVLSAIAAAAVSLSTVGPSSAQSYPQQADQDHRALYAGLPERRDGAPAGATSAGKPRTSHRHRQPAGWRDHDRDESRRTGQSRWIHAVVQQLEPGDRSGPEWEAGLRSAEGLRSRCDGCDDLMGPRRGATAAGEIGAGIRRSREGQPGQIELRLRARDGFAAGRRNVQGADRDRHRQRSLQGRRGRHSGLPRRSNPDAGPDFGHHDCR